MSKIYAGLDVAKLSLQLHFLNKDHQIPNSTAGFRRLLQLLQSAAQEVHLICEATGGLEQNVVTVIQAAGHLVSVVQPLRVRQFAQATGWRPKTDRIDATLLCRFGQTLEPRSTPPLSPSQSRLREFSRRRSQLVELLQHARNQAAQLKLPELRRGAAGSTTAGANNPGGKVYCSNPPDRSGSGGQKQQTAKRDRRGSKHDRSHPGRTA